MAGTRATWTLKDLVDMLRIKTGTVNESDITPKINVKLLNSNLALLSEQLEGVLFPYLFKQQLNVAVASATQAIFAKDTGSGGTYSSSAKTITFTPTNNVLTAFSTGMNVIVWDGTALFTGTVASYGSNTITLSNVLSPSGCSTTANAIVWVVGVSAPAGVKTVTAPADYKKIICVKDSTTKKVIEMFDERKFANAQQNLNYEGSAYCYVMEGKIYIYVGADYGSTISNVDIDYIRRVDKLTLDAMTETIDMPDEFVQLVAKAMSQSYYEIRENVNGSVGAANDLSGTLDRIIQQSYPNNINQTREDRNNNAAKGGARN